MVFARMVHFYSPTRKVWFFSPSSLALIFVTLDVISFVIQLVGGGMAGPGASAELQKKGLNIYMGGIGMQEGFIVLFLGLVIKFHRDQLQAERVGRLTADKTAGWKWLICALYACLLTITIRIIYRLAEFSGGLGASNPLPSNEPVLYVLESTPMWLAILVWNIVHPGRFIHGEDAKMPRSWLSRHLCYCCRKHRCDECNGKLGHAGAHHHRMTDDLELEDNQHMHPAPKSHRGRVTAVPSTFFRAHHVASLLRTATLESRSAFAHHQLPIIIAKSVPSHHHTLHTDDRTDSSNQSSKEKKDTSSGVATQLARDCKDGASDNDDGTKP